MARYRPSWATSRVCLRSSTKLPATQTRWFNPLVRPLSWFSLAALALPACFSPSSSEDTDAEGTGTATGSGSTGSATTNPNPSDSGVVDSSGDDPTNPPDTTATSTGDTSSSCIDASECNDGLLCIDGACAPCTAAADPDEACNDADPATPVCDPAGTCAACVAGGCAMETPYCDPQVGCLPCDEHSQCPDSACHLLGPMAGQCFDPSTVIPIADEPALAAAIEATQPGDQAVLVLAQGDYETPNGYVLFGDEIAIVGEDGAVITTVDGASNIFIFGGDGQIVYFSNIVIDSGPFRAIRCDGPGRMWLDDTAITNFTVSLQTSCETHARRSHLQGSQFAMNVLSGSTFLENSTIVPGTSAGLSVDMGTIDVRYSNIVGGTGPALTCTAASGGEVRNSILASMPGFDAVGPDCSLQFSGNAVGPNGSGVDVGPYDATWFVDAPGGNYHLSAAGELAFDGIAQWEPGDPTADIDGDARPQVGPGFAGVDEVP